MNQTRLLRILAVFVAALAVSFAVLAVMAAPFLFGTTRPATVNLDSILVNVSTDKAEYAPGETVQITATVHNAGPATVTLVYGDSCGDRIWITDSNGTFLWVEPGLDSFCLQVIGNVPLAPGETIVSRFAWNQTDFTGAHVPPGSYQAVYFAHLVEGPVGADAWISIRASG